MTERVETWRPTNGRRWGRRRAVGVIVACGFALGACGSSDGAPAAGASDAGTERVEPVTLVEAARFGRGRAVAAATDGTTLVVATTIGVIARPTTSDTVVEYPTSLTLPVVDVALTADGRSTLLTDASGAAELWTVGAEPELLAAIPDVVSAAFTDDGAFLLVAEPLSLSRLSTVDGSVAAAVELAAGDEIASVAWDPEAVGGLIVTGPHDGVETSRWSGGDELAPIDLGVSSGIERIVLDGAHQRAVVTTSIDGQRFEGRLEGRDLGTRRQSFSVDVSTVVGSQTWAFGSDGRVLTVDGSRLRLFDVDGTTVATWAPDTVATITDVRGLRRSSGYAVADTGGTINVFDADGTATGVLPSSGRPFTDLDEFAGSPGIVSVDDHGRIRMWAQDGTAVAAVDDYAAGVVREVDVSPTGDMIGFGTSAGNAGVLPLDTMGGADVAAVTLPTTLAQTEGNIDTVRFTGDDAALLTGVSERNGDQSFDDTQTRWDLDGPSRSFAVGGVVERVMGCVAFHNTIRLTPDGTAFVAPFHDFTVSLRRIEDGSVIHEFPAHASSVLDLAVSPDGTRLVTASDDWTVRVWDLGNDELVSDFETAPGGYRSIAYLPDGTAIVTADISGVLRLLDVATGSLSEPFDAGVSADGRLGGSPDGRYVAAGSADGRIGIWATATGESLGEVDAHHGGVTTVAFTPDGHRIASGSTDGTIKVWEVVPA